MTEFTLIGLRVLREVTARGSFSAAGAALGYTQSAISRHVAALEQHADAKLFIRTNRGVRLTDDGVIMSRHAATILQRLDAAECDMAARRGKTTRRLRVGAFSSAMVSLVPDALRRMRDVAPDVRVTLSEGASRIQLQRLRSGTVDVAIVAGLSQSTPEYEDLQLDRLFDDPLLLAVARTHWLASARGVTPDVLADEAWIVGSSDRSDGLLGAWDSATWAPRIAFTAKDWNAKIGLVAAGLGVTVVPGLSAASFGDRIRLVRINDDRAARAVLLARPASATTTEPSHQLATILREQIQTIPLTWADAAA